MSSKQEMSAQELMQKLRDFCARKVKHESFLNPVIWGDYAHAYSLMRYAESLFIEPPALVGKENHVHLSLENKEAGE